MKLLITLISMFLFMIQAPVQAEEANNHASEQSGINVNIDALINDFKVGLDTDNWKLTSSTANVLLTSYKEIQDPMLQKKILDTFLIIGKDGWTYLHYASLVGDNDAVITVFDAFKDKEDILGDFLLAENIFLYTFFHVAATQGKYDIIKTTLESLKDNEDMLKKLFQPTTIVENTFLHMAAKNGRTEVIATTFELLKDRELILDPLLMSVNMMENTYLHEAAKKGHSDIIETTLNFFIDELDSLVPPLFGAEVISENTYLANNVVTDRLNKLLFDAEVISENTYLHRAAENGHINIFSVTFNALKDRPKLLKDMLVANDRFYDTFLHKAARNGESKFIEHVHNTLKQNSDIELINELFSWKDRIYYQALVLRSKIS